MVWIALYSDNVLMIVGDKVISSGRWVVGYSLPSMIHGSTVVPVRTGTL